MGKAKGPLENIFPAHIASPRLLRGLFLRVGLPVVVQPNRG